MFECVNIVYEVKFNRGNEKPNKLKQHIRNLPLGLVRPSNDCELGGNEFMTQHTQKLHG